MNAPRTLALLALLVALAGCQVFPRGSAPASGAGYRNLSPSDLRSLLASTRPFLLDVHVPNEGYLAGTDARIPYTEVAARAAELPPDRDAAIVVYCMTGRMSTTAAEELVRLGYRQVINLDGGMVAWKAAGYEVLPEQPAPR